MPTLNPRINLTMPSEMAAIISDRAQKQKTSLSKAALELIAKAIELDEDVYFSRIADSVERRSKTKWVGNSDEIWK